MGALLLVFEHRRSHIVGAVGMHQQEQGMLGAVCVPKGEDGVVVIAAAVVDFSVQAAVGSVHVAVY